MTFGAGFGFPRARFPMGAAPTLNMDFAGTAALPPYVTFSRGTNATYVDSLGNIAYAPSNLLTYSEQFDNAAWGKTNATVTANTVVAPNGTTTSDVLIADATNGEHLADQLVTVVAGNTYTLSAYVKASGLTDVGLRLTVGSLWPSAASPQVRFNLLGGTATIIGGAPSTYSITAVGGGWYRCSMSAVCVAGGTPGARVQLMSGSTNVFTGNGVDGIATWGAQLNLDGLQPYNSTTVKNLLGYTQDFDNAAWTKSNSFIQTNLLTYSEQFDNAAWVKSNSSITQNVITAPDGALTADKLVEDTATSTHFCVQNATVVSGALYTFTCYIKAAERLFASIQLGGGGFGNQGVAVNLTTGASTAYNGATSSSVTSVGNGWWRISVTATASGTSGAPLVLTNNTLNGQNYTGDGTSGIYLWGAQLVQGATPGDYQATTTTALAVQYRAPDGSLTADKAVGSAAVAPTILQPTPVNAGTVYTYSVYVKAAELGFVRLQAQGAANTAAAIVVNLSTLAISSTVGAPLNAQAVPVGNDFVRISFGLAATTSANAALAVYLCNDASGVYTGDGTSGIYIWGAQLSDSASLDPYSYNFTTAPTAAAYYGPRFDYDPTTLACKGLLIEEQRTNSIRNNTMQGAVVGTPGTLPTNWAEIGAGLGTLVRTIATGIENGISYVDIKFTGTTSTVSVGYSSSAIGDIAASNAQTWTGSGYYKIVAGSTTNITNTFQIIEERTGAGAFIGNTTSAFTPTATLTRFTQTHTLAGGATVGQVRSGFLMSFSSGVAVDFTLRIGLPQLELGAFATSVIPTTTTAVTRAADVAVIQGANFSNWYNQSEGTIYAQTAVAVPAAYTGYSYILGDFNNGVHLYRQSDSQPVARVRIASSDSFLNGFGAVWTTSAPNKNALAYAVNSFASSNNGSAVGTSSSGAVPTVSVMYLGALGPGSFPLNGHIARIAYYSTRQPNATLQAITT